MTESFNLLFAEPGPHDLFYPEHTVKFLPLLPEEEVERNTICRILQKKTTRRDIRYRQEILNDFRNFPSLLYHTEEIFRKWEKLQAAAENESDDTANDFTEALTSLKKSAVSVMDHLLFLKHAAEELSAETPGSQGLFFFQEWLRKKASFPAVCALWDEIETYPMLKENTVQAVLHLGTDQTGALMGAELEYLGSAPELYLKRNPGKWEPSTGAIGEERIRELTFEAAVQLRNRFRSLTHSIRACFKPLKEGLIFYHFGLSLFEWGQKTGNPVRFASPTAPHGPAGTGILNLTDRSELPRICFDLSPQGVDLRTGSLGSAQLKIIAQTQIFSACGLPIAAKQGDLRFCPEERIVLYDSEGKTVEDEIKELAEIFRNTKQNDLILLHQPLITVGNAPAEEIIRNLLKAFRKKGARIFLASDITFDGELL